MSTRFDDEDEWSPWYWRRFWRSRAVARMSDSAVLLYKWLLDYQWEHGHLEPPDAMRQLVPGRFAMKWKKLWAEVQHEEGPCFVADEKGCLRNEALAHEREISIEIRKANSARASLGGKARARRLAEAELEERSKRSQERASSSAPSTAPSTPEAVLVASTSPDRTRPEEPPVVPLAGDGPESRPPAAEPKRSPAAELRAWWSERFPAATGQPYPWRDREDGRAAAGVLELAGGDLARVREVAERLLADPFWRRTGFDLTTLRAHWTKLLAAQPDAAPRAPVVLVAPDVPAWKRNGFSSEDEWHAASELAKQPKPKLGVLLAAARNGHANGRGG